MRWLAASDAGGAARSAAVCGGVAQPASSVQTKTPAKAGARQSEVERVNGPVA